MNREQKLETGILDLIKIYNDKGISLPPYNLYMFVRKTPILVMGDE